MQTISVPIADSDWQDVQDAFATAYGFPAAAAAGNPVTPEQFVSVKVRDFVLEVLSAYLVHQAELQAAAPVAAAADKRTAAARNLFQSVTGIAG